MALIPWRSKSASGQQGETPLARFRTDMDTLMDRFFRDPWGETFEPLARTFGGGLRLDVSETADEVTVAAEDRERKERNYRLVERSYGRFQRTVQLPATVDSSKVDAQFRNGVLTIKLPKRPEAKPRKIDIKVA